MVRNQGKVTRFVVMAMLQAARARSLGLSMDSALSWGLNRAIFYAALKRGFRESKGAAGETKGARREPREVFRLGDDEAFRDPAAPELRFTIGEEDQTPEEFRRQVASRFGSREQYESAWGEAMTLVGGFERGILESRSKFYNEVYKPRRDELSDLWTQKYSPSSPSRAASAHRPGA